MSHVSVTVSIVIVNWNTQDILRDCLRSVYGQTEGISFEVIVVDNASSDGSAEMVVSEFPQAILIRNATNRGFAAANNQGIAVAKGRYVLLLNSDTIVLDKAIVKTVVFAERHLDAAVVGCRVLNPDRSLQPTCFMFPSVLNMALSAIYLYKVFPRSRFLGRECMTWWDRSDERDVEVVTGCFMLVRREAIDQVGPMDEAFFMYGEETDWCYRFVRAGWRNRFTPTAETVHLGGASTRRVRAQMILQLRGSILLFIRKHHSWLAYVTSCAMTQLFFIVRVPFWGIRGLLCRQDRRQCFEMCRVYGMAFLKLFKGCEGLLLKPRRCESE